jgi:serine phosphatase RsbU (regulator of sigma subunit)/PAS domain-containing protein
MMSAMTQTTGSGPGGDAADKLVVMLDSDPNGWAIAAAVREGGQVVDLRLDYLNDAGARILGRDAAQLLGRRYRELWPETVDDGTLPFYVDVIAKQEAATRTVFCERATLAGHFQIEAGPWGDGLLIRFVDLAQVTVSPHGDHGARLYAALDAAFDGFVLLQAIHGTDGSVVDFRCEYVNHTGAALTGHTTEHVIGAPLSEVSPAASSLFPHLCAALAAGTPWRDRIHYPDVDQHWEINIARAEEDRVAVSFRDVTDQARLQADTEASARTARRRTAQIEGLQAVTAALVAARTSADVYAAIGAVVRPSAGGHGLVVLVRVNDRLVLRYQAGYEPDVVASLRHLPLDHQYPATTVARTGRPQFLPDPAAFHAAQPDPASAISGGGRRAWAFLPLTAAGDILGVLVIGYTEPRAFDTDEQAYLTAFAGLSAQALQRARLYEEQVSIAGALQRALLPPQLPTLPGVRHAVRYLPWTAGADVGGDWYDLILIRPDTIAVVIGDVIGHSSAAAATMGQIRGALRAYATDGHSPAGVLERVNNLLLATATDSMATCCYLELHLVEGTATAVLAGHPAPVLRAGGTTGLLALRTGPPLGVQRVTYPDTTFELPPNSALVLYTDGLVEDHKYDLTQGLTDLCTAITTTATLDPEPLLEHILSAGVGPDPRTDDVAILALTVDPTPGNRQHAARRTFRTEASSAAAARRFTADILTAWGHRDLVDDACLLVDEVVTNAILHTVGDVEVELRLTDRLLVAVHDGSDRLPRQQPITDDSLSGRGLHIVERLAGAWGVHPRAGGKTVWLELPLDPTT